MKILLAILAVAIWGFGFFSGMQYAQQTLEPEVIEISVYYPVEKEIKTTNYVVIYETEEVPIHNEPGLYEFTSRKELEIYLKWYRTEKMTHYGARGCMDYAYDFMNQAISDGYLVSTEVLYTKPEQDLFPPSWSMINTAKIGRKLWGLNISMGSIKIMGEQ